MTAAHPAQGVRNSILSKCPRVLPPSSPGSHSRNQAGSPCDLLLFLDPRWGLKKVGSLEEQYQEVSPCISPGPSVCFLCGFTLTLPSLSGTLFPCLSPRCLRTWHPSPKSRPLHVTLHRRPMWWMFVNWLLKTDLGNRAGRVFFLKKKNYRKIWMYYCFLMHWKGFPHLHLAYEAFQENLGQHRNILNLSSHINITEQI